MEQRICKSISQVLGQDLAEDLTQYILGVENEADFEDYMKDLLDFSVKEQRDLYEDIKSAKFGPHNNRRNQSSKEKSNNSSAKSSSYDNVPNSRKSSNVTTNSVKSTNTESNSRKSPSTSTIQEPSSGTADGAKKKTKKFRKFQLNELQKGYLRDGRNPCECQASKHKLINNCIECGRIVCEQEGSGPCFFCDNMVCTKEEMEILNSDTKESDALYRSLNDRKKSETWRKAIQARNKLLDYDKSSVQQTKIIDDEHDYFEVNNQWLSKKDREKAVKKLEKVQEQKHGSRLGARKIMLDILGKQAIEDFTLDAEDEEENNFEDYQTGVYKPCIPDIDTVMKSLKTDKVNFKENKLCVGVDKLKISDKSSNALFMDNYIIQDKTYLEMSDKGMCLSMHQPWASLLVLGIKQHEGRTWYTPHRGTLWIASTSKPAEPDTVKHVEDFYKEYYSGTNIQFPDIYPTGSLLGNVLVQDCLSQEEYREQFPRGESDSPYVLICSDPQKIIVPIPMKGEHKIYKLNAGIHRMARDALILKKRFT